MKKAYDKVRKDIRTKTAERKKLQTEKKSLSPLHVKRHMELASSIAGLTEEIEELRSERDHLLARAKCAKDKDMKDFAAKLDRSKREFNALIKRKTALTEERQDGITQYEDTYERIQTGDDEAVAAEQKSIRENGHDRLTSVLNDAYGDCFDPKLLTEAENGVDYTLTMDRRVYEHRKRIHIPQRRQDQIHQKGHVAR